MLNYCYPHFSKSICLSLVKIKKNFKKIDLILSPAVGGIVIGYEIGRLLKKEIYLPKSEWKILFKKRFTIKKFNVLIIEDDTTGKSSIGV